MTTPLPDGRVPMTVLLDEQDEAFLADLASRKVYAAPVVTEVAPLAAFYPAEAYHQKYYQQNPEHFEAFEEGSGRTSFQQKTWGDKR